jgi:hypothetical protein
MHLWLSLPTSIENGAVRTLQQDKEVQLTDGGYEVRNTRWASPLRSFQIGYNNKPLDDADHAAVEQMWRDTNGGTDTFNFADERSGDTARVRFDAELQFTNTQGPYHHLDAFTLREVRDVSPEPTVIPGNHRNAHGRKHADLLDRDLVGHADELRLSMAARRRGDRRRDRFNAPPRFRGQRQDDRLRRHRDRRFGGQTKTFRSKWARSRDGDPPPTSRTI